MKGKLHVYTGDGKGKTTAAMGLALRCVGHGMPVLAVQFMKDGTSGEILALKQLPGVTVLNAPPMGKFTFLMTPEELAAAGDAHRNFAQSLQPGNAALVILDELSPALAAGLLSEADARQLISRMLASAETVVTGRYAPEWLTDLADYVSRIAAEKHPYDTEGLDARPGIEF